MIPATATWLDAMIKAMSQVVIPAVGDRDAVALEQANLVLHHLRMLRQQHPWILHYQQQQTREAHALTAAMAGLLRDSAPAAAVLRDAEELLAARADIASQPLPALAALEDATVELKAMANRIAEAVLEAAPSRLAELNKLVLQWGEPTVLRERAWLSAPTVAPPELDPLFRSMPAPTA